MSTSNIDTVPGLTVVLPNVVLLAYSLDGNVIAISRRGEYKKLGLPGGKIELGETSLVALQREIREELNYELDMSQVELVYEAKEDGVLTGTYRYGKRIDVTKLPIINTENCYITAVPLHDLMNAAISPFAEYNSGLIKTLGFGVKVNG